MNYNYTCSCTFRKTCPWPPRLPGGAGGAASTEGHGAIALRNRQVLGGTLFCNTQPHNTSGQHPTTTPQVSTSRHNTSGQHTSAQQLRATHNTQVNTQPHNTSGQHITTQHLRSTPNHTTPKVNTQHLRSTHQHKTPQVITQPHTQHLRSTPNHTTRQVNTQHLRSTPNHTIPQDNNQAHNTSGQHTHFAHTGRAGRSDRCAYCVTVPR